MTIYEQKDHYRIEVIDARGMGTYTVKKISGKISGESHKTSI